VAACWRSLPRGVRPTSLFKWEGFEANELVGTNTGNSTNAVQMRLKRIIKRLRHRDQQDRRRRTLWMQPVKKFFNLKKKRPFSLEACPLVIVRRDAHRS